MSIASHGNTVKVHYTGVLNDGTQFDSSVGREPLEFTLGMGNVIPGFEQAVLGMVAGQSKSVTIPANEAYGEYQGELLHRLPREQLPDDIELTVGLPLQAQGPEGQIVHFVVADFDAESVTLDANHPLAGQDLTFQIELLEVA
jgi:peptidylprolyl isomerase